MTSPLPHPCRLARSAAASLGLLFLGTLLPASLGAAPIPEDGIGYPRDVSTFGYRIDWLINITAVFTTILFIIMCAWMLYACLKHGAKNEAEYDHGESKHAVVVALVLSSVIFLIVDGNLFVNAVKDLNTAFWNYDQAYDDPEHVRIEINAHQWAWDARYAGPDGLFNTPDDIVTLNDVRVPVGRPVILQIAASDVIHSFGLPNLRIKQDAIPGTVTQMWFEAKETGQFDISCQQHCGTNHYKMRGVLTILRPEDYDAWAEHASRIARLAYDPEDTSSHWGWEWEEL